MGSTRARRRDRIQRITLRETAAGSAATSAIEGLLMQLRKTIKARGRFPSDEAAIKLMWAALRNMLADKVRSAKD
jgi:transposase-like protein